MSKDIEYIEKNEFKIFTLLSHGFHLVETLRINKFRKGNLRLTIDETKQVYGKIN